MIEVGNKIAKVLDWGDDFTSDFAGFVYDGPEYGWRMVYVGRVVPTVRPANGVYTVTSVRHDNVLFKDGDKDWLDEVLPCTFFTIEGWDKEYMVIDGEAHSYWLPVKGEGFDFTDLSLETLAELSRDYDYRWDEYISDKIAEREAHEAAEDAYYEYLERKAA